MICNYKKRANAIRVLSHFLLLFALSLLHLPALHQIRISSSRWKVLFHLCILDSVRKAFSRKKNYFIYNKNFGCWLLNAFWFDLNKAIPYLRLFLLVVCIMYYRICCYCVFICRSKSSGKRIYKKCYTYFDSLSHKAIHQSFHEESQKRKSHSNLLEKASFLSFFLLLDEAQEHYLSSLCSLLLA